MPRAHHLGLRVPRAHGALFLIVLSLATGRANAQCPNSPIFSSGTLGFNGWTLGGGASTVTSPATGSRWVINPGLDPQVKSPIISCAAASFNFMRIGTNNHGNNTSGRVYYDNGSGFAESRSVGFTNPSKPSRDSWRSVRLGGAPGWTGTIRQIRVDPVQDGSGDPDNVDMTYVFWRNDTRVPEFRTSPAHPDPVEVTPAGWTTGDITVAIRGMDPTQETAVGPDVYGSGCTGFNISLDGAPAVFKPNTSFDDFSGDAGLVLTYLAGDLLPGDHTLTAQPVDLVGHVGTTLTRHLFFDDTGPNAPVCNVTPGDWTNGPVTASWNTPVDPGIGVGSYIYELDGTEYPTTATSVTPSLSTDDHTFRVLAVDGLGNRGDWSAFVDLKFDGSAPQAPPALAVSPKNYTNSNSFIATWGAATDAGSGVASYEYQINSGPVTPISDSPLSGSLATLTDTNTLRVRAVDVVGLRGPWSAVNFFYNPAFLPPPQPVAPGSGVNVALPEVFSWTETSGAPGYELQIAPAGDFAHPSWSTQTSLTSVLVPAEACPTAGSYAWRLRSLGSTPSDIWTETPVTFFRVASVPLPAAPALDVPAPGASVPSGTVVFQWDGSPGATSYRLEVADDPSFAGGPGTAERSGITVTNASLDLPSVSKTYYWRVRGKNASGEGAPSPVQAFTIVPEFTGIASVVISNPPSDIVLDQGVGLYAKGITVARYSGSVTADWLWDGEVLTSTTLNLSGGGAEIPEQPLPTDELGLHTLQLRVSGPQTVLSPIRNVQVATPGFGAADRLVVVADQAQILAGGNTTLYCTVRDADGAIVLTDVGRAIHFEIESGEGSLSVVDALSSAGFATTVYSATANETNTNIIATAPSSRVADAAAVQALRSDRAPVGASLTALRMEQSIADGYLTRLGSPSMEGVPGVDASRLPFERTSWPGLNIGKAYTFVHGAKAGDEARLHRLNIYLRYLDRALFYDPEWVKTGTREPNTIPGAGTMYMDYARTSSKVLLATLDLVQGLDFGAKKFKLTNKFLDKIKAQTLNWLRDGLLSEVDRLANLLISRSGRTPSEKQRLTEYWTLTTQMLGNYMDENLSKGLHDKFLDLTLTQGVAALGLDRRFMRPVQTELDRVVDAVKAPTWNGGNDTPSTQTVNRALAEVRSKTQLKHNQLAAVEDALGAPFVSWCETAGTLISNLGGGYMKKFADFLFFTVKNSILWSSGYDCVTIGNRIADQAVAVADVIIAPGGVPLTPAQVRAQLTPPATLATAPLSGPALHENANQVLDDLQQFELTGRELENAILTDDTTTAKASIPSYTASEALVRDGTQRLLAPLFAALESARLSIGTYEADIDSLGARVSDCQIARLSARTAIDDWLQATDDRDALRAEALAQLRTAIDSTKATVGRLSDFLPQVMAESAIPYLSIDAPVGPPDVALGEVATIRATVRNLGGGSAVSVGVVLGHDRDLVAEQGEWRGVGDLAPGESREVSWLVRFTPTYPDADSLAVVRFHIFPDSASGAGDLRQGTSEVVANAAALGVRPPSGPRGLRLAVTPNPARGRVRLTGSVPAAGLYRLEVLDISGRAVHSEMLESGAGDFVRTWDAGGARGIRPSPGIYFVRLSRAGRQVVTRFVLRQ